MRLSLIATWLLGTFAFAFAFSACKTANSGAKLRDDESTDPAPAETTPDVAPADETEAGSNGSAADGPLQPKRFAIPLDKLTALITQARGSSADAADVINENS